MSAALVESERARTHAHMRSFSEPEQTKRERKKKTLQKTSSVCGNQRVDGIYYIIDEKKVPLPTGTPCTTVPVTCNSHANLPATNLRNLALSLSFSPADCHALNSIS